MFKRLAFVSASVLLIGVLCLFLSIAQYYGTGIPGKIVFPFLYAAALINYFWQNRAKVFRKATDKY